MISFHLSPQTFQFFQQGPKWKMWKFRVLFSSLDWLEESPKNFSFFHLLIFELWCIHLIILKSYFIKHLNPPQKKKGWAGGEFIVILLFFVSFYFGIIDWVRDFLMYPSLWNSYLIINSNKLHVVGGCARAFLFSKFLR